MAEEEEEDINLLVRVTHVVNPSKFWIRNVDCDWKFCQIQNALLSYIVEQNENPEPAETIILGRTYFCCLPVDFEEEVDEDVLKLEFYRIRIIAEYEKNRSYQVYFMDVGGSEVLDANFIFDLPSFDLYPVLRTPDLAMRCSLFHPRPLGNKAKGLKKWPEKVIQRFCDYVNFRPQVGDCLPPPPANNGLDEFPKLTMQIMSTNTLFSSVDMVKEACTSSLRDYLLFRFGKCAKDRSAREPNSTGRVIDFKELLENNDGDLKCEISWFKNPYDFYVRPIKYEADLEVLEELLADETACDSSTFSSMPNVGTLVAVTRNVIVERNDGKALQQVQRCLRAVVQKIIIIRSGWGLCQVRLLDSGALTICSLNELKSITFDDEDELEQTSSFFDLPFLGIRVSLDGDLTPDTYSYGWSNHVVLILKHIFEGREVVVKGASKALKADDCGQWKIKMNFAKSGRQDDFKWEAGTEVVEWLQMNKLAGSKSEQKKKSQSK